MSSRPEHARQVSTAAHNLCGLTDVGHLRSRNEDFFLIREAGPVLLVADGLGGLPAGDVASRVGTEAAAQIMGEDSFADMTEARAHDVLFRAVERAHGSIVEHAAGNPSAAGMATTLVAAIPTGSSLYISHVGDVRAYAHTGGRLVQLTRDHSLVGDMVARGLISSEEARTHPNKNLVTQALGLEDTPVPSFVAAGLGPGDLILLCSDGLWETMEQAEIEAIVGDRGLDLEERLATLADRALDEGGSDNITGVLYEHV